jgi:hypothetical protein
MKIGNGYEDPQLITKWRQAKALFPIEVVTLDNIQCSEDSSILQCDRGMGEYFTIF